MPTVKYSPQTSFEEGYVIEFGQHRGGELMSKPDGTAKKISENAVWMKAVAAGSIDEL